MDFESEEITLPALPGSEPSLPLAPPSKPSYNRKRPFLRSREPSSLEVDLAETISTSSDPAFFSNDETPDAENYSGGVKRRKKRMYRGTWWDIKLRRESSSLSEAVPVPTRKRSFRRNIDSGIFMADDSSATDLSSEGWLEQELLDAQERECDGSGHYRISSIPIANSNYKKPPQRSSFPTEAALKRMPVIQFIDPKDDLVSKEVQRCLDKNDENVDLIGLDLDHLPESITDLKSMIKRIKPGTEEDKLAPFEAELKLYLANNSFERVPRPLLELSNIQLLSLRQNNLTQLSEGIRRLVNLRELNISSNKLQYLPFEMLGLLVSHNLTTLHSSPNPWMPLPPKEDRLDNEKLSMALMNKSQVLTRWAVGKPTEFCASGSSTSPVNASQSNKTQPHFSEIILRALARHNVSGMDLSSYLSEEHPLSVRQLITTLHLAQSVGGRLCTFCLRDIVLPRYQWYEWWDVESNSRVPSEVCTMTEDGIRETLIPFQRMCCGCVNISTGLRNEERKFECQWLLNWGEFEEPESARDSPKPNQ